MKETRLRISTVEIKRGKTVGHLVRHDNFIINIIEGKGGRGRPRHLYIDWIKEKWWLQEVKETAVDMGELDKAASTTA